MTLSRSLVVVAALLAAALLAVLLRAVRSEPTTDPARGFVRTTSPEAAELAELRQEVAQLKRQLQAQTPGTPTAERPAQPPSARDPAAQREAREAEDRAHRDYVAGVAAAFRSEASDARWASAASSAVHAVLASEGELRAFTRDVECRSRSCRVEITDDGSGKLDKALPMFAHRLAAELPSIVADRIEAPDGTATIVLYMSRSAEPPVVMPGG